MDTLVIPFLNVFIILNTTSQFKVLDIRKAQNKSQHSFQKSCDNIQWQLSSGNVLRYIPWSPSMKNPTKNIDTGVLRAGCHPLSPNDASKVHNLC